MATHQIFPGLNSLRPPMKQWPKKGTPAMRTADASTKWRNSKPPATPKTPPGLEVKGHGTGVAGEGTRGLDVQWLNRHQPSPTALWTRSVMWIANCKRGMLKVALSSITCCTPLLYGMPCLKGCSVLSTFQKRITQLHSLTVPRCSSS